MRQAFWLVFGYLRPPASQNRRHTDAQHHDGQLAAVVLLAFVPGRCWQGWLHNQTAWLIKAALWYNRRQFGRERVIIDVPFYLR